MTMPIVPGDPYHDDMMRICIAMAHEDYIDRVVARRAHLDSQLDDSYQIYHDWRMGQQAMDMSGPAGAVWVGMRYLSHMHTYATVDAATALALLRQHITGGVLGASACLATVASKPEDRIEDSERALALVEQAIERRASMQAGGGR